MVSFLQCEIKAASNFETAFYVLLHGGFIAIGFNKLSLIKSPAEFNKGVLLDVSIQLSSVSVQDHLSKAVLRLHVLAFVTDDFPLQHTLLYL